MGRIVNTDSIGKRRNQLMRTAAEMMRHLSQKQEIDDETKDMLALLVYTLREISDGILEATKAWEKRNYWVKIEQFEQRWGWSDQMAGRLERMIINEKWAELPEVMVQLFPKFADIKVTKFTRDESEWKGRYAQLMRENS